MAYSIQAIIVDPVTTKPSNSYNGRRFLPKGIMLQFVSTVGLDGRAWVSSVPLDAASLAALIDAFGADRSGWIGRRVRINDLNIRPVGAKFTKTKIAA